MDDKKWFWTVGVTELGAHARAWYNTEPPHIVNGETKFRVVVFEEGKTWQEALDKLQIRVNLEQIDAKKT
jgi:hypothetical protein